MTDFSTATLSGHIGKDAAIFGEGERRTVRFSVGINDYYFNGAGAKVEIVTWVPCVGFGTAAFAEMMEKRATKGARVTLFNNKLVNNQRRVGGEVLTILELEIGEIRFG